jgi:hypothetical protein
MVERTQNRSTEDAIGQVTMNGALLGPLHNRSAQNTLILSEGSESKDERESKEVESTKH